MLTVGKEVLVNLLDQNRAADTHADTMFQHQLGQTAAVDQDHTLRQALHIFLSMAAKRRCGDKDAVVAP